MDRLFYLPFSTMAAPTINAGHQTWSDTSNATSTTAPVPTTLPSGDRWIIAIVSDPTSQTFTFPAGFTEEWNDIAAQSAFSFGLAYKASGGSESNASITVGTSERQAGVSFAVTGMASGFHAKGTDATGSSTTAQIPAITTSVADCLVIGIVYTDVSAGDTAPTTPSGWTLLASKYQASGGLVAVYYRTQATAGTISATNVTLALSEQWAGIVFALEPASSGTAHNLTASAVMTSTTPNAGLSVNRPLTASAVMASTTPNAILSIARSLTASAALASNTPSAVLSVSRSLTATAALTSTTPNVVINVTRSLVANAVMVSVTSDIRFAGNILFAANAAMVSSTSTPILSVARSFTATATIVSSTPTVTLLNRLAFTANAVMSSSTSAPVLAVARSLVAMALLESVTSDPILSVARMLTANAVLSSQTPEVQLTVARWLVALAAMSSTTSTATLSIPIAPGVARVLWVARVPQIKWSL